MKCTSCGIERDSSKIAPYTNGTCIICLELVRDVARQRAAARHPDAVRLGPRMKGVRWQKSVRKRRLAEEKRKRKKGR